MKTESKLQEFTFNTGVKYGVNPYADEHYRAVPAVGGGFVMVIPFYCYDVPESYKFVYACDNPNLEDKNPNFIVREIHNSKLISKYAYFKK